MSEVEELLVEAEGRISFLKDQVMDLQHAAEFHRKRAKRMEKRMAKKKEIPVGGAVATVAYRDGTYTATISIAPGKTFRSSCTVSARDALLAAADKWRKWENDVGL